MSSLFYGLGGLFIIQGLYYCYFATLGSGMVNGVYDFALGFCVFGIPAGLLCLSIAKRYQATRDLKTGFIQFGVILAIHLINFAVWMSIAGPITRFGGAVLSLAFAGRNMCAGKNAT